MIDSEDIIRTALPYMLVGHMSSMSNLKQPVGVENMNDIIEPTERPFVDLEIVSNQLISGSLYSVPLYVGLAFAKEYKRHDIDKRTMETVIRDLQTVVDETQETNEQLNKELGHLSAKNDQLINDFNEQSMALEQLLKALNKKPTTNNLVLDLAIAITELQARGNKNV